MSVCVVFTLTFSLSYNLIMCIFLSLSHIHSHLNCVCMFPIYLRISSNATTTHFLTLNYMPFLTFYGWLFSVSLLLVKNMKKRKNKGLRIIKKKKKRTIMIMICLAENHCYLVIVSLEIGRAILASVLAERNENEIDIGRWFLAAKKESVVKWKWY